MKKILSLMLGITFAFAAHAQTVFQLPNAGFEQWDGGYTSEPTHWNTFSSSDGSYASLASDNHHYRRSGRRPGGSGSYYLTLYTRSILGIKANGNMTTGRIHAGSMNATSSDNYNYTQRSNGDHSQPFTATPDSMYVWVSFYAASRFSEAQVEAVIHGERDFKAPNDVNDTEKYRGRAVAKTTRTTDQSDQMGWTRLRAPFVYNGTDDARYILINITTNNQPGEGEAYDSISVDDIEFVYSAWLNGIQMAGNPVNGFQRAKMNYALHVDDLAAVSTDDITATPQADDASIAVSLQPFNDSTLLALIDVTAEDGVTTRQYKLYLCQGAPQIPVGLHPADATVFSLYPNPAQHQLTVRTDATDATLTIYNMQGQQVLQHPVNGTTRISLPALPAGCYTATLNGQQKKLIISQTR